MFQARTGLKAICALAPLVLVGCASPDLVVVGLPNLLVPPSMCKIVKDGPDKGKLIVTVKNDGAKAAPATTTTVDFNVGGSVQLPTPALPAFSAPVNLTTPVLVPAACYTPNCSFKITIDAQNQVPESNEGNNNTVGWCVA